jgi:hypothetical protein
MRVHYNVVKSASGKRIFNELQRALMEYDFDAALQLHNTTMLAKLNK